VQDGFWRQAECRLAEAYGEFNWQEKVSKWFENWFALG
jgi:hypothetical protein